MPACRTRGHPRALAAVSHAIGNERPPHALLLVGPSRVGKTTLAFDLASGLLCLAADPSARPCAECAACRKVAHGNHPDVHVLAPEGPGGQVRLGQVQALISALALLPAEGRFRVAIVEQAHRLNQDAQNALLKTLEEPPTRACLILAADESGSLLPTLVSRCARLRLAPVAATVIGELLADHASTDPVQAAALGRMSGGRPGAALALARQPEVVVVRGRVARQLLDLTVVPRRERLAAVPALLDDAATLAAATGAPGDVPVDGNDDLIDGATGRPPPRRQAATRRSATKRTATGRAPAERRAAVAQLLAIWRDLARDLILVALGGRAEVRQHELLDEMAALHRPIDEQALAAFLSTLDDMERALDGYANPELLLDVLLLSWPRSRSAAPSSSAA